MAKINLLDSSVYNLIAAGEVVERPSSVVKELVENCIDAGARNITIEIKNGGISFIQVSDDGHGIEEDDLKFAFLPHATSKIKSASDLDSIFTLGFRGEALASIASVSKVKLVSKTSESELGNEISINGGNFGETKKTSCKNGTTITVEDLFYCVPARAKFLKKEKTEEQEITNIVSRTILANPEIDITYIVDGKKQLSSLGKTKKEAMFSIYGKESVVETLEVSAKRDGVSVLGFVGKPTYSKSNRTYQTLIINGRYVVNSTVQTAVANAYGDFLMKRQYPFFVLYLSVPSGEIDVNVHPNKLDVKFLKSNLVYSVVFEAVSKALHNMDYIKEINIDNNKDIFYIKPKVNDVDKAGVNLNPFSGDFVNMDITEKEKLTDTVLDMAISTGMAENDKVADGFGLGSKLLERINRNANSSEKNSYYSNNYNYEDKQIEKLDAKQENNKIYPTTEIVEEISFYKNKNLTQIDFAEDSFKVVGKIFNTYLAIEWGNNLYLIDQHAGHERLKYDKLKKEYEEKTIVIQPMLIPFVLTLNVEDNQIINDNLEAIRSVGFEIDEFGDRTYKISAVPAIVSDIDFNKFFSMFLSEKLSKQKLTEAELIKDTLMQMACKSAIKGGDDLSKQEIDLLLHEMSEKGMVLFCPHGRPVVVRVTKNEIEKWFKRII